MDVSQVRILTIWSFSTIWVDRNILGTAIQGVVQELDAQAELVRQREYLERNLSTIRDKLKKDR